MKDTYTVQSRKQHGKYQTHITTVDERQAMLHYQGRNVGAGFTKRLLVNGVATLKCVGI